MAEFPEPADGTALYWPPHAAGWVPVVVVRDDKAAALAGHPDAPWFTPNDDMAEELSWPEMRRQVVDAGLDPASAVVLLPPAEVDRLVAEAVAAGGGAGRCVHCGRQYNPIELERLRQRNGGGSGG